ncbi:uncharacterized protein BJ171DRAFT_480388 [Polychytrium aggregatum]|uniref:uncharacterized protein n=1 Tax=Polychytrium aggregatum TaxID=110093 RepID=UPI0022FE6299|nr:uncharacterized protein BJ171DRAFT_480388 [Polychytrium aggregatum]KAI9193156.1 hypothetical protein BJ171DRAFT_480388 [Polychytrium aggregatum]
MGLAGMLAMGERGSVGLVGGRTGCKGKAPGDGMGMGMGMGRERERDEENPARRRKRQTSHGGKAKPADMKQREAGGPRCLRPLSKQIQARQQRKTRATEGGVGTRRSKCQEHSPAPHKQTRPEGVGVERLQPMDGVAAWADVGVVGGQEVWLLGDGRVVQGGREPATQTQAGRLGGRGGGPGWQFQLQPLMRGGGGGGVPPGSSPKSTPMQGLAQGDKGGAPTAGPMQDGPAAVGERLRLCARWRSGSRLGSDLHVAEAKPGVGQSTEDISATATTGSVEQTNVQARAEGRHQQGREGKAVERTGGGGSVWGDDGKPRAAAMAMVAARRASIAVMGSLEECMDRTGYSMGEQAAGSSRQQHATPSIGQSWTSDSAVAKGNTARRAGWLEGQTEPWPRMSHSSQTHQMRSTSRGYNPHLDDGGAIQPSKCDSAIRRSSTIGRNSMIQAQPNDTPRIQHSTSQHSTCSASRGRRQGGSVPRWRPRSWFRHRRAIGKDWRLGQRHRGPPLTTQESARSGGDGRQWCAARAGDKAESVVQLIRLRERSGATPPRLCQPKRCAEHGGDGKRCEGASGVWAVRKKTRKGGEEEQTEMMTPGRWPMPPRQARPRTGLHGAALFAPGHTHTTAAAPHGSTNSAMCHGLMQSGPSKAPHQRLPSRRLSLPFPLPPHAHLRWPGGSLLPAALVWVSSVMHVAPADAVGAVGQLSSPPPFVPFDRPWSRNGRATRQAATQRRQQQQGQQGWQGHSVLKAMRRVAPVCLDAAVAPKSLHSQTLSSGIELMHYVAASTMSLHRHGIQHGVQHGNSPPHHNASAHALYPNQRPHGAGGKAGLLV